MDANGSRFHLLSGRSDWKPRLASSELVWDEDRGAVSLAPRLLRFPERRQGARLSPADRRGAACDRFGNWYWISDDRRGLRWRPPAASEAATWWSVDDLGEPPAAGGAGDFTPVPRPDERELPRLAGLAVTEHHYLVVGTSDPAGLLIFDLHGGGPPEWRRWPAAVPFTPFDLAATPDGGLWVLDRPDGQTPRLWRLDCRFRVLDAGGQVELRPPRQEDFGPQGGAPRAVPGESFPTGVSLELASPLEPIVAVAVAALPDGSVLVLESDPAVPYSVVHRRAADGTPAGDPISFEAVLAGLTAGGGDAGHLMGHDFAFLGGDPGSDAGDLYVVVEDADQAFAFALTASDASFELELRTRFLPLRRFTGKALVEGRGEVYYDLEERWLPLTEQPRARYASDGAVEGLTFDGREPGCVWHRLLLDAHLGENEEIEVSSRAADRAELLAGLPWRSEPRPVLRRSGSEVPYHRPFTAAESRTSGTGTWEILFQHAAGRYLELRLTLRGNGRGTPRIRALRAHYPRFSYLEEYLPAVYREDAASASFLERFLANPEGLFTALEGRIAQAQALFDLRTTDPEYLDWLAGWLGAVLDPSWDEERRRLFLAHAEKLFRWRGTRPGLERAVRLAIDPCPDERLFEGLEPGGAPRELTDAGAVEIVEGFLGRTGPGGARPGETWSPSRGAAPLHGRYQLFLAGLYGGGAAESLEALNESWGSEYTAWPQVHLSPVQPADAARRDDWRRFLREGLGFTYAPVGAEDEPFYREYLARRYGSTGALARAWRLSRVPRSFAELRLPSESAFPETGPELEDWIRFVSLVVPMRAAAHRFTVMVPVRPGDTPEDRERRLEVTRQVVAREKPAHTDFHVELFWALLRVGEVRLGRALPLGQGSRYTALALGGGYLGGSHLTHSHPWSVAGRRVLGRDPLTET